MAVIKVACPKCGQKVSGDESFYDKYVNCPICTSKIMFPANPSIPKDQGPPPGSPPPQQGPAPVPGNDPFPTQAAGPHPGSFDEAPPQASQANLYPDTPRRDDRGMGASGAEDVPSPLMGSVALVVGILNTVSFCLLGVILAPVAIILGHIGLAKAKNSPVKPAPGQTHALIGVILGYTGLIFTLIALLVLLLFKDQIHGFNSPPNG